MCAWMLEAERRSLHYGLRLGAEAIPPNTGPAHERQCLRALG
ncbi:hypothetical protein Cenrod_2477 [Candidatus Symbiobacter mobilis CR]|uniref:Uncharacterized protein n=1 Tax=Candidatus Symbiobacter mobilis CR TaxID=946483 RepID=U5NAF3_9BURK|nr:hypothetical protein Cenrod_2477 [Candidatus Symbiobacter mobilis CR]